MIHVATRRIHVYVDLTRRNLFVVHTLDVPHQAIQGGGAVALVDAQEVIPQLLWRLVPRGR
eukprot:scaffold11849_cov130-Isochrysis_galbana.AAC.7